MINQENNLLKNKKPLLVIIFLLALLFFILELFLYYALNFIDFKFSEKDSFFLKAAARRKEKIDLSTLVMRSAVFDPDLGFDSEGGIIRGETGIAPGKIHFASTYGASFTYCDDVIYQQSWQYVARQLINHNILNLAVAGYCTDQAYLKFLKYYTTYPTDVVFLGFLPTILPGLTAVIDNFDYMLAKPRYIVKNNSVNLYRVPFFNKPEDLVLLNDKNKLFEIMEHDEIYRYIKKYYGLELIEYRKFPFTLEILKMGAAKYRAWRDNVKSPYDYIENRTGLHKIIKYLIDQFIAKSIEYGFYPVFLINCDYENYRKEDYLFNFQNHIDYMKSKGVMTIEIKKMFKHEVENSNINTQQLFELFGGHYSYLGNQIIAHKLAPLLKLLKEKKYKDAHKNLDSFIKLKPDYKKIQDNLKIRDFVTQPFSYQSKNFLGDPVNTNIGLDLISENDRLLIEKAKEAIKTARNFIKTGNIRPALIHYKKALEYTPQWVEVMNEYAWVISTSGQAVNNTQDAIALAGLACEASKNTNPLHLDTLAAAYARAGKYKDALGIAQIALKRAIVQKIPELEKSIKKRIEVYKSNNYYTGKR